MQGKFKREVKGRRCSMGAFPKQNGLLDRKESVKAFWQKVSECLFYLTSVNCWAFLNTKGHFLGSRGERAEVREGKRGRQRGASVYECKIYSRIFFLEEHVLWRKPPGSHNFLSLRLFGRKSKPQWIYQCFRKHSPTTSLSLSSVQQGAEPLQFLLKLISVVVLSTLQGWGHSSGWLQFWFGLSDPSVCCWTRWRHET